MEGEKFDVFLKKERLPLLIEIAKITAEFRGILVYEASQISKYSWGFLGENLSGEDADKLLAISAAHGLEAGKAVTSSFSARAKESLSINYLDFENGKLNYGSPAFREPRPLNELVVTAYASIKHNLSKTIKVKEGPSAGEKAVRLGIMMTTGLPIGMGKSKEVSKELKSVEMTLYMELIFSDGLRLSLNSDKFDFSCLKEKKTYSSQMNFALLCLELAKHAPGALKNTGMFDVLEKKLIPTLQYDSPSDLEKEIKRLLLLSPAGL